MPIFRAIKKFMRYIMLMVTLLITVALAANAINGFHVLPRTKRKMPNAIIIAIAFATGEGVAMEYL